MALARAVLAASPDDTHALMIAGGAEAAQRHPAAAWEFYSRIPTLGATYSAAAACVAAHLRFFDLHHPADAERLYRDVLMHDPDHPAANSGLANLLGLTGRRWEAIAPTLALIRQGECATTQLILIGSETGGHEEFDLLAQCATAAPSDPVAALGMGWQARHRGDQSAALGWVERALQLDSTLVAAHVFKGTLLAETQAEPTAVRSWHSAVPAAGEDHPELWLARGQLAQQAGADAVAARCYWETLRRNPNYRVALFQLSQWLIRQGDAQRAQPFVDRSAGLQRLKEVEAALFEGIQDSTIPIQRVVERLVDLGRFWEAWGWCQQAQQIDQQVRWPLNLSRRFLVRLTPETPLTHIEFNPAHQVDLSDLPWSPEAIGCSRGASGPPATSSPTPIISFRNDTPAVGLEFTHFNSATPREPGQRMYEFSGGGVAGVDYDLDGWCDLYFTQGCQWPPGDCDSVRLDQVYRNAPSGGFVDVTTHCRIREPDFSQGIATGDYDNDGFPDIYVANIGANRLFRNLGDGTFEDATALLPQDPGRWTTSVAMADLNGDGWPDLYAANYLEGPDIFKRICQHKDGVPRMCAPFDFPGSQDQFLLNQGDCTFIDATEAAGFKIPQGKGLGVLVADFEQRGRLDVFVANDLVPNFFFRNQAVDRASPPQFEECGLWNGVAFNAAGQAQGCMGIAADDFDGDHSIDLLITNFYMETNVLYLQDSRGVFRDGTRESGLAGPSLPVLGFGAQSVDADLDGRRDLVVTNGHVDDHRAYGQPYAMPAQVFRGLGDGRFEELPAASLGPFFAEPHLGRGMARLDWNRDGREDLAISHIDSPAALLTNASAGTGHALVLQLRGTVADRDAIGTQVTVAASGGSQKRQLTAGDGYQASNQRQLVFGLGNDSAARTVEIRWPSGSLQTFHDLPADREWLIIEQRASPLSIGPRLMPAIVPNAVPTTAETPARAAPSTRQQTATANPGEFRPPRSNSGAES
ncbi:MAG: FG-GAP-like repeat-containing protein [Planctomycetaceae bacterium]|nr:FG-GAP-like repeat-containing protein [Planctomycetaceae bacterium]